MKFNNVLALLLLLTPVNAFFTRRRGDVADGATAPSTSTNELDQASLSADVEPSLLSGVDPTAFVGMDDASNEVGLPTLADILGEAESRDLAAQLPKCKTKCRRWKHDPQVSLYLTES